MEHQEKQIISLKGFSNELQKEANAFYGLGRTLASMGRGLRQGFSNPNRKQFGQASNLVKPNTSGGSITTQQFDDAMSASRRLGQHLGRNKGAYGIGTGVVGTMTANKILS